MEFLTFLTIAIAMFAPAISKETNTVTTSTCKQTADVIFVVDTSSSIWPPHFNKNTKDFIKAIIGNFNVGPGEQESRIGLIQFSTRVYREFQLKDYSSIDAIEYHINKRMRYRGGNTYTHKALDYVAHTMLTAKNGWRKNVTTLVIIITDGESGYPARTKTSTDVLKTKGVEVFAIGIGPRVRQDELKYMASNPDKDFVFHVKSFSTIGDIEKRFANQTCNTLKAAAATSTTTATTTTTTTTMNKPTSTTATGTTSASTTTTPIRETTTVASTATSPVTTTTTSTTTTTPPTTTKTTARPTRTTPPPPTTTTNTVTPATSTTTPPTTTTAKSSTSASTRNAPQTTPNSDSRIINDHPWSEDCQGKQADIYFLLDTSSSVWIGHFNHRVLPFVRDLVKSFDISPSKTRVGLVTFSDKINHVFDLHKHDDLESLLKSLQPGKVPYLRGGTNTGDAISFVTEHGFGDDETSRKGVAKIIIALTDGMSQFPSKTIEAAKSAHDQGIQIFAVGVGKQVDDGELYRIASNPGEDFVFMVESFRALSSSTELLTRRTCSVVSEAASAENGHDNRIDCSINTINVMFAHAYMNSIQNYKQILDDFVHTFTTHAATRAPRSKIGLMTQPCIGGDLTSMNVLDFQMAVDERRANYGIVLSDIVHRLRMDVFKRNSGLTGNKIAVLVLDNTVQNHPVLYEEVKELKSNGVQVVVLAIGQVDERLLESVASYPMEQNVIRVDKYDYLKYSELYLLERICHSPEITFYPLPRSQNDQVVFNAMVQ